MPHSYISANAVIDRIVNLRKEMIGNNKKVSINDFIIKASALALRVYILYGYIFVYIGF